MAAIDTYDAVVLGSGEAGKSIAWHLGATGKRVAVVEQRYVGGSCPNIACLPSNAEAAPLTHVELLDLDTVPEHLLILGGSYVGLELGQAMRRLGSRVTVCERAERLLPREDGDIAEAIRQLLQGEGIAILSSTHVDRVSGRSGDTVVLHAMIDGAQKTIEGSHLLVALGKTPNTNGIGLERAGIKLTPSGYVKVNDRLETTASAVCAMGDCAGSPAFTHMAFDDFRIVRDNLRGSQRTTTGRQVPFSVSRTRAGARRLERGRCQTSGRRLPAGAAPRLVDPSHPHDRRNARQARGTDREDDRILGFTAFGPQAGELLPPIQIAMRAGLSYHAIEELVVAHPTYAEGLVALFSNIKPLRPDMS